MDTRLDVVAKAVARGATRRETLPPRRPRSRRCCRTGVEVQQDSPDVGPRRTVHRLGGEMVGVLPIKTAWAPHSWRPPGSFAVDNDQERAPFLEALLRERDLRVVPFTTPGHKLGTGVDPALRAHLGEAVFASDVWLGAGAHEATLRSAQALAAPVWGADCSFFLTNGSTSGNLAFFLANLGPGDQVVMARDIHKSLLVGLILTGARPIYVAPRLHPSLGLGLGIAAEDVAAALDAHPAAKLVALVSPSYWGMAGDVAGVAGVAHARGVPVYVDQAWGPHFGFHPCLPPSAMAGGADGAVTSAHKLLPALTPGAILNLRGSRVDPDRVATTVRMVQATSPSIPILASIDAARRQMALDGSALLERAIALADEARRRLSCLRGVSVLDPDDLAAIGSSCDRTRLLIDARGLGMTGFEVELILRERFAVAPEMSDATGVVCLVTAGDSAATIDRLVGAFATMAANRRPVRLDADAPPLDAFAPSCQALTPREAFFAQTRTVGLADAVGEVAVELVIPFPPGIPVLAPGEIIEAPKVDYLRQELARGMCVCGVADPSLATIRVVADPIAGGRVEATISSLIHA